MGTQNTLAASVQPKKGRLYAVIQVKENGKVKAVWRSLSLPEGTEKSKVNKAFRDAVCFELPHKLCSFHLSKSIANNPGIKHFFRRFFIFVF